MGRHSYGSGDAAGGPVSQLHTESDPLLAFCAEQESPVEVVESAKDPPADDLRVRLARVEHELETLVSTVADIQKRHGRPPEKPAGVVVVPSRRAMRGRTIAAILAFVALGAVAWGIASAAAYYDTPDPPPVLESVASHIVDLPAAVAPQSPYSAVVAPAVTSAAPAASPRLINYVGTLTIDADPAGDVFVNRENMGRTPMRLEKLRAGSHLIWIQREGYRRWTRVVAVAADRVSHVSATLDPIAR